MKETDRGGEKWVSVASQLVKVGTGRSAARPVPPQRLLAVNSSFHRAAFRGRSANGPAAVVGPFRLMGLSDLTESELRVYLFIFFPQTSSLTRVFLSVMKTHLDFKLFILQY